MDIPVHRGEDHFTLRKALRFLQELLEVLDCFLHHFRGLKHERENQLSGAELVAHFFHRWQQNVIENAHRVLAYASSIEPIFDAFFLAVQNHPVDALIRG